MNDNKKSRVTLLVLFMVFFGPLLVAVVMFALRGQFSFLSAASYGTLIHPAQPIAQFNFETNSQIKYSAEFLQGKWTYLYFASKSCDLQCEAALFKIRQIRIAAGKDLNRVQYLLLATSINSSPIQQSIFSRHNDLVIGKLLNWKTTLEVQQQEQLQVGFIYVIDPVGNLMMKYDMDATSKGMLKDLKKLLRISNIG